METSTTLLDLNKDQLSEVISSVKAKLRELGLDKLDFNLHKQLMFGQKTVKHGIFVFEGLISSSLKEKVDQLRADLKNILGSYGEDAFAVEVEVGLGEGEKFPVLNDLNVVPTKETGKTLECASGEVVLVDFWATWCGPCQRPMQHNQEMLEKNEEKWKGKARIVGVSLDDDIESVIQRVEERKWQKVEHFHAPGGFEAPAASQFGINGIPCVFLVDKKGMIRYRGHPSSVNLEDKINELIAESETSSAAKTEEKAEQKAGDSNLVCNSEGCSIVHTKKSPMSLDTESELIKQFQEKHEAHKNLLEKSQIRAGIIGSRGFKANGEETFDGRILLAGVTTSEQKNAVLEYFKNVVQPLSKDLRVDNRLGIQDNQEIKFGTACATCKKALGKGTSHYICTACQSEGKEDCAFCLECADKELTQEINTPKELFHQHGLLLVYEDTDGALKTLKRILNDVELIPEEVLEQQKAKKYCRGIYCDGCRETPVGYRWACASCDDFDFCTECYKASRDPNHEKHKEITEAIAGKGHDQSHLFYRSHYMMYLPRPQPKQLELPVKDE